MKKYVLPLLTSILSTTAFADLKNTSENNIVNQIDININQSMALLQEVVDINSGTMNFTGVRQVGDVFRRELDDLGFKTWWVEANDFNRAGHLMASYGNRGPRLLLIGHLDTVFSADSPFQKFEAVSDAQAKGPGIVDMKGGNVIMIYALRALKAANLLDKLSLRIIMTGDEEKRGRPVADAIKPLTDAAIWADVALGFENADGNPATLAVSRRGVSGWTLKVSGKPAHSSQIFREDIGFGAVFEAARILEAFRNTLASEENLTFNPALIAGGTDVSMDASSARSSAFGKDNVIAKTTIVSGDIRALSPQQLATAQQKMQKIVSENLAYTDATIQFEPGYPPMEPSPGNLELLGLYDAVSRDLGFGAVTAVDPRRAGAADISFAAAHVDMAIDGLGLMGTGGHTNDETADLPMLSQQTKRAAVLLYRLATQKTSSREQ